MSTKSFSTVVGTHALTSECIVGMHDVCIACYSYQERSEPVTQKPVRISDSKEQFWSQKNNYGKQKNAIKIFHPQMIIIPLLTSILITFYMKRLIHKNMLIINH